MRTRWGRVLLVIAFTIIGISLGYSKYGPHYAPADSLAGPMTPDWRDFADDVDHICARNNNAMIADLSAATTSSEGWHIQHLHQTDTYREIAALGEPPARPELFHRWLANVGLRASKMEQVSQALAEGRSKTAILVSQQIDALKVDANWLGQHFGLRICTSNGPGREPGDSSLSYLEKVNQVCLRRNDQEDFYASRNSLIPDRIIQLSSAETRAIAAIGPPTDQYPVRQHILALKSGLDRLAVRLFKRGQQLRPKFKRFWDEVGAPRIEAESDRVQIELAHMGLPACGNWGPTPATSLFPRG